VIEGVASLKAEAAPDADELVRPGPRRDEGLRANNLQVTEFK
jgi:hypothetical protein